MSSSREVVAGVQVTFGVLGPVAAWDGAGGPLALRGPRHRAVLARLVMARGRVVPVTRLVDDLWWAEPPEGAIGAVRTFVAALRRALEPDRSPRAPARLLVTDGPGYALRADPDAVDAWRFEDSLAAMATATLPPGQVAAQLADALGWWRGPAYADFADEPWARAERSRLAELRLHAIERRAQAQVDLGRAAEAVPDLDAHVTDHPWREDAWCLLAVALYRTGRQGDALAVLHRARALLVDRLGVDPGPRLRRLEADILAQAEHLDPAGLGRAPRPDAAQVWAQAAAAYDRTVATAARARLESTVGLLRSLAVTGGGGLEEARRHRLAPIAAAEETGDVELTARVIGAYDVPAIWTRSDDPDQAAQVVAAAERTLARLPADAGPVGAAGVAGAVGAAGVARARLLATIALESRGTGSPRARRAAQEAEEIARAADDPALLAFALNAVFMQSFHRAGLAARRDEIGAELVNLSASRGLVTFEVLGHLIRLQARCALADLPGADRHATEADRLARRHELPLVAVFTGWYQALRLAIAGEAPLPEVEAGYHRAARRLEGAGMPGVERGLLPLALLCLRVQHDRPVPTDDSIDWGPYEPWARPLVLLGQDDRTGAAAALQDVPDPPRDLLYEALWCLTARAAIATNDQAVMRRALTELSPAARELAGAGSGLVTLGPVSRYLDDLRAALRGRHPRSRTV